MLNRHHRFFSSLKQVEDRLTSEQEQQQEKKKKKNNNSNKQHEPTEKCNNNDDDPSSASEYLTSSPLFLNYQQHPTVNNNYNNYNSNPSLQHADTDTEAPPLEFLSHSTSSALPLPVDDLDQLMGLLGLSKQEEKEAGETCAGCWCCCNGGGGGGGGGGFYGRVMEGVRRKKGWRCEKERRRLDGWIQYYYQNGGDKREPVRLAHLLLAKALSLTRQQHEEDEEKNDNGESLDFGEMEFPSTVYEHLKHDPPQ